MSDNLLVEVRYVEDDTRQTPGRLTGTLVNLRRTGAGSGQSCLCQTPLTLA